ncbi:putative protein [Arabidopsis thaliana]|uniref:Uncharacterized protein AT4g13470 n=1 Tax=Arabidopsis thaliana TaxID=3702 RepID=Q9T0G8_ARATH|nr:putative protein [Arabidopsis thaliana]CAB78389.1 putative protein [Arabidopsis thaliana]
MMMEVLVARGGCDHGDGNDVVVVMVVMVAVVVVVTARWWLWLWLRLASYDGCDDGDGGCGGTSFWYDNWCSLGSLYEVLGARGCIDMGISSSWSVADVLRSHVRRRHRTATLNSIEDEIDALRQRHDPTCDIPLWKCCNGSFKHKFFSRDTWYEIPLTRDMLGSRYTTRWDSLVDLSTSSALTQIHMFVFRYVFQLTTHSLWKERNGRRHGESPIPAPSLAKMIDKNMRNRLSTLATSGSPIYKSGLRYWFSTHCR